jgi:hypothetical protein
MSKSKLWLGTAISVALAIGPAQAGSSFPPMPQVRDVTHAQWRHGGGGHRGGWGWGPWAWLGLGAGVVAGAIIADEAYRPHPGHYYDEGPYDGPYYYPSNYEGDPREICAQSFRSFDWRTGFYRTYSGERRLCPYLRDAGPPPRAYPYGDAGPLPPEPAPYRDSGLPRPRPDGVPYDDPGAPSPRAAPYSDAGPPPRGGVPYDEAGPLPQGQVPYSDAGPPRGEVPNDNAEDGPPYGDPRSPSNEAAPY